LCFAYCYPIIYRVRINIAGRGAVTFMSRDPRETSRRCKSLSEPRGR